MTGQAVALPARKPRAPALFYSALIAIIIILISVFALTARQPPPPTIAEFAPQAQEQITEAPQEQSSEFGTGGEGECPEGAVCAPGEGTGGAGGVPPPPIDVPRVRKCVGDPPRQIEDPQSPPCVPYWEGDNGGETYFGVTRNEIRVVAPEYEDNHRVLEVFFNKRFEFYGRKLRLIDMEEDPSDDPSVQRAHAVAVKENYKAFAALEYAGHGGFHFYPELARLQVMGVANWGGPEYTEGSLKEMAPYIWSYPMAIDRTFANVGEWACKRLAGRNASHAGTSGTEDLKTKRRKFGVVMTAYAPESPASIAPLEQELEQCGETLAVRRQYYDEADPPPETNTNIILQMKEAGVTSIFCLCQILHLSGLSTAASSQQYYPEWLLSTYNLTDSNFTLRTLHGEKAHLEHTFGITVVPRQVRAENNPCRWAAREVSTNDFDCGGDTQFQWFGLQAYRALLLLASGIQMAGPNLTPESFEHGLHRTRFPNPDHPNMAGKVGFQDADHTMTNDGAEWWWSTRDRSPYADEGAGTICYVEGGRRYSAGNWPTGPDPFFQGPCDSGA